MSDNHSHVNTSNPKRFRVIDATAKLDDVCAATIAAVEEALGLGAPQPG